MTPQALTISGTATVCAPRLLTRLGQSGLLVRGLLLLAVGIGSWAWTSASDDYWLRLLHGLVVAGAGMGIAFLALTGAALTGVPPAQHGVAGAVNASMQQIGASVGLVCLIEVAAARGEHLAGFHAAYGADAAACASGALTIGLAWPRRFAENTIAPNTSSAAKGVGQCASE